MRFIAASTPARVESSTRAMIALNGQALPAWERRLGRLGIAERHLRHRGYLYVFHNKSDFAAACAGSIARQQKEGIAVEVLADHAAVRRLEPAFGPKAIGAAHYPTGVGVDNPATVSKALGEAALARGAVLDRRGVVTVAPVTGGVVLTLADGTTRQADMLVIAAGVWSKPLTRQLGDHIPIDSERGYNLTLPKGSLGLTRTIILEGQGVAMSPFDDCDRLGGAVEFAGTEAEPNYARVDAILARTRPYLPDAKFDGGERWMGHRPSLPDSLPVISRSSASDRIIYAFGHGHYGLTQSAATAEIVGALVDQGRTQIDIEPFSARRF